MTTQPTPFDHERRRATRVDTEFSINYQIIARLDALKDPYSTNFAIPSYFLMSARIQDVDHALERQIKNSALPSELLSMVHLLSQKLDLLSAALYDTIAKSLLPTPMQINISESGLSFYSMTHIRPGTHLHLSLSHAQEQLNICAIVRVVYCDEKEQDHHKIGAYFVSMHPSDHTRLAKLIDELKIRESLNAE